jgi:phosphate-selective porin OprO and OprP
MSGPRRDCLTILAALLTLAPALASGDVAASPAGPASAGPGPAATVPEARVPADRENSDLHPTWTFDWRGWDGIYMELVQPTPLEAHRPVLDVSEVKFASTLGGKLEIDAAAFPRTTGDLTGFNDGVELRRARFQFDGNAILLVPFDFYVDLGYVPRKFTLEKFYLSLPAGKYLGTVRIGQFQPSMGLQLVTSSWNVPLMEPAAPLQALGPGTRLGFQVGRPVVDGRGTWTLGANSGDIGQSEYGSAGGRLGSVIGRATWLAIDQAGDGAQRSRLLHVGLSAEIKNSFSDDLQYRTRPESYIAPYVLDTGSIDASSSRTLGTELAWVDGPFSAQAEFMRADVNRQDAGSVRFHGWYAMASWYLTGESRPYDHDDGAFGRLRPTRDFGLGSDKGWGALELVARYSYTDLSDADVLGGRLGMLMCGLNWYLTPHVTWEFNVGRGRVRDTVESGDLLVIQTRVGVSL